MEEDLGTASGSFCFIVLKLGLRFLYISSFVFLVSFEPRFSFTFALLLVVVKDSPVSEQVSNLPLEDKYQLYSEVHGLPL